MTDIVPVRGQTARQDFGGGELTVRGETAAVAVAAQAKAAVEARYIIALKKPREWQEVRLRLEKECLRPGFAASAWYRKPIGKGVEGPSIRFAEAALRCMTNCYPETSVIYEGDGQRIVKVMVTDLESNLTYSTEIVIEKTVERSFVKDGQEVLGERLNSSGKKTYLVRATEDDLLNKQNALISKALRTNALRLLPGDIMDGCEKIIRQMREDEVTKDPDETKRNMVNGFDRIGIGPIELTAYLGHSLDRIQPSEILELHGVFTALKEKETTWSEVIESRGGAGQSGNAEEQAKLKEESAKKRGFGSAAEAQKATEAKYVPQSDADETPMEATPAEVVEPEAPAAKPVFGRRK